MDRQGTAAAPAPVPASGLRSGGLIEGVDLWPLQVHADDRGSFTEVFHEAWTSAVRPVQWSVVTSAARVLRGMHLHWEHDEYFMLLQGRASVGLRDARPLSPTFGTWALYELSGAAPAALTFPRGLLHGWYFHEPSLHLQAVSEAYLAYHPHDNIGCRWDDPDLEIPWPDRFPLLSERAASFGTLREILIRAGASTVAS